MCSMVCYGAREREREVEAAIEHIPQKTTDRMDTAKGGKTRWMNNRSVFPWCVMLHGGGDTKPDFKFSGNGGDGGKAFWW